MLVGGGFQVDLHGLITNLATARPVFHNEADFQHALAWKIHERHPNAIIRLEMKVHGPGTNVYLDILVVVNGKRYGFELKYKTAVLDCEVNEERFALNGHGAQDVGRYDVLKDVQRLESMVDAEVIDEGVLVFLTNDPSYFVGSDALKQTVDRDFRLHDGTVVHGTLAWGEAAGAGTTKGREKPLHLRNTYRVHWAKYSHIDGTRGDFRYLLLSTQGKSQDAQLGEEMPSNVAETSIHQSLVRACGVLEPMTTALNDARPAWFSELVKASEIPLSQLDLRDKVAAHLRALGYQVSLNRELGGNKVDVWAESNRGAVAIEVRNKSAKLETTVYHGESIALKNQAAQDISRYDFISDISKLERALSGRTGVRGYALLITNDPNYWREPKHAAPVDEHFRVHEGNVLEGVCSWSDRAGAGTTRGREQPIALLGRYALHWQPYVTLEGERNVEFKALLVEVTASL